MLVPVWLAFPLQWPPGSSVLPQVSGRLRFKGGIRSHLTCGLHLASQPPISGRRMCPRSTRCAWPPLPQRGARCLCEAFFQLSGVGALPGQVVLFVEKPAVALSTEADRCAYTAGNMHVLQFQPHQHLLLSAFCFSGAATLMGVKSYLLWFLLLFLVIGDVEHLFVCSICVSSSWRNAYSCPLTI